VSDRDSWEQALRLAATQRGLVTGAQLRQCGLSMKVVHRLTIDRLLRVVRPGVYAIEGRPSQWEAAVAVGLLGGPGSALSHGTAAAIHRLHGVVVPDLPEISVSAARRPRLSGATVHRVVQLDPCDIQQRSGVGVTTPHRTVVDLAMRLQPDLLCRVIDEGTIARRWTVAELLACTERSSARGRSGVQSLRQLLMARADEPRAESMLEIRMIRILAPFAPFETQYELILEGRLLRLDIAWPRWRVAAEVDGWGVRSRSRTKFDEDRYRMNLLLAHHWRVVHLTSAMSPPRILRDVGRLLSV
jgi:hypothetical protein